MIAVLMPCMSSLGKAKAPVRPLPKDANLQLNTIVQCHPLQTGETTGWSREEDM